MPPLANASLKLTGSELTPGQQVVGKDHLFPGPGLSFLAGRFLVEHRGDERSRRAFRLACGLQIGHALSRLPAPSEARRVLESYARTDTRVRLDPSPQDAASVRIVPTPRPPKSFLLSSELSEYLVGHGMPPDEVQEKLIEETAETRRRLGDADRTRAGRVPHHPHASRRRARRAIEVGTFTGYSALCIARGLPDDGQLICCDVSEEWTRIGRRAWAEAGVADRIDLRIAPALDTLGALPEEESFDLAFIDADKPNYQGYFDALVPRLRTNGAILVDNVLWDGNVVKPEADDDNTRAIRAFNDRIAADDRVDVVMLPIADGLTLARKR